MRPKFGAEPTSAEPTSAEVIFQLMSEVMGGVLIVRATQINLFYEVSI